MKEQTERGRGWVGAVLVQGPGTVGGFWISPAALRDMVPGVLDVDLELGVTLAFDRQSGPEGPVGVLTETGAGAHRVTARYDLEDGVLLGLTVHHAEQHSLIELQLAGRE